MRGQRSQKEIYFPGLPHKTSAEASPPPVLLQKLKLCLPEGCFCFRVKASSRTGQGVFF